LKKVDFLDFKISVFSPSVIKISEPTTLVMLAQISNMIKKKVGLSIY